MCSQQITHDSRVLVYASIDVNNCPTPDRGYHHNMPSDIAAEHKVTQKYKDICVVSYYEDVGGTHISHLLNDHCVNTSLWASRSARIKSINCVLLLLTVRTTFCAGSLAGGRSVYTRLAP